MRLTTMLSAVALTAVVATAAPVVLSTNGSSPALAAGADSVAVVWHEADGLHHALVDLSGRIVASETLPLSMEAGAARIASDGRTYLMVWIDAAEVRIAILDAAGRHSPVYTISSNARADVAPVLTWDGSRYLVFWSATENGVQFARFTEVTPQGVSFAVKNLPSVPAVASAISSNGSTAIVWSTIELPITAKMNLATITDGVVSEPKVLTTHFWFNELSPIDRDQSLAVIDNQYYAAWVAPRQSRLTGVVGTRVTADGKPLDFSDPQNTAISGKSVYHEFSQATSAQLRSFAIGSQYVLVWHAGNRELTARVGADGSISTASPLMVISNEVLQSSDAVPLANGKFAIAYELGRSHRVELLFSGPGPKRRATR